MDVDKLTNEIFSILENKFLFGYNDGDNAKTKQIAAGKVRILSIDAGGSTSGALAAKSLVHLEAILKRKSGKPNAHISDFFDVVAGAGAGGIIAALLFTRRRDGSPVLTSEESLRFVVDNRRKSSGFFKRLFGPSKFEKVFRKVFGDLTLKDTVKSVLIPCYDLDTGSTFVFSRADALEMDGCDFGMSGVCEATAEDRAVEVKSIDGRRKIVAVGGGVGMSNPTAAAITHVLNNKREFPVCKGVEDLLVMSLGNGEVGWRDGDGTEAYVKIAGDGAADMVDQAVSMAFGQARTNSYVRIQGNGILGNKKHTDLEKMADEILGEKNVESVLFKGKKLVENTNLEKLEMFAGELIKEEERRKNSVVRNVVLKHSSWSPRTSSDTTLSTVSSD